jgi:hypothetical protein
MAHFAELNNSNIVQQVIVVSNEEILDNGVESEAKGIAFCQSLFGEDTRWVQTSYNKTFRKNFAGIGDIYDPIADHFIAPQPYPSWILDSNAYWNPPIPYPNAPEFYSWNEEVGNWEEII